MDVWLQVLTTALLYIFFFFFDVIHIQCDANCQLCDNQNRYRLISFRRNRTVFTTFCTDHRWWTCGFRINPTKGNGRLWCNDSTGYCDPSYCRVMCGRRLGIHCLIWSLWCILLSSQGLSDRGKEQAKVLQIFKVFKQLYSTIHTRHEARFLVLASVHGHTINVLCISI